MIISEINAFANLLGKAGALADYVKNGWYESTTELSTFRVRVETLSQKHEERLMQLRRFGQNEDPKLYAFAEEAEKILTTEQGRASRLQKSRWERLKTRVFPGKLTEILESMEVIVNAGIQALKDRAETSEVLERNLSYCGTPLPFQRDPSYVPIAESIAEVQSAVENVTGPRVVVIYGDGGLGKTGLVKYIALHYDKINRESSQAEGAASQTFPDGVFYLKCGKGSSTRLGNLEQELLDSLGFGSESRADHEREGGCHIELFRLHKTLLFKLARRKSLIILDDVHETEVLERLLIPSEAVTYLITSRKMDIWPCRNDVQCISMKKPSFADAKIILGMYTQLAADVDSEDSVRSIIQDVDSHPLMLANIGLAMGFAKPTGPIEWRNMAQGWQEMLQRNGFKDNPVMFRHKYQYCMEESIKLMMDALEKAEQSLLQLMSLLKIKGVPEAAVKFLFKQMNPKDIDIEYDMCVKQLEYKSLLEVYMHNSQRYFAIHRLRAIYIRKTSSEQLKSMAMQALELASSNSNNYSALSYFLSPRRVLQKAVTTTIGALQSLVTWSSRSTIFGSKTAMMTARGDWTVESDREPALLTGIMTAMYLDKVFLDAAERDVCSLLSAPCRGLSIIPRRVHAALDVMELIKRARDKKDYIKELVPLLNPDGGAGQEAQHCAAKIIVRFICRKELDDTSAATLVRSPSSTAIICCTLNTMLWNGYWFSEFVERKMTFSSEHSATFKSFLDHSLDDSSTVPINIRLYEDLSGTLIKVLNYEEDSTIFSFGEALLKMFSDDTKEKKRDAFVASFFGDTTRAVFVMGEMPDLRVKVFRLLIDKLISNKRGSGGWVLYTMSKMVLLKDIAPQILDEPGAVDVLWARVVSAGRRSVSKGWDERWSLRGKKDEWKDWRNAISVLGNLTMALRRCATVDNVERILPNQTDLGNFLDLLSFDSEAGLLRGKDFSGIEEPHSSLSPHRFVYVGMLVELLGNLGITKRIRETIVCFHPEVLERLQTLELLLLKHTAALTGVSSEQKLTQDCLALVAETRTILSLTLVNNLVPTYDLSTSTETFTSLLKGKFYGLLAVEMYEEALVLAKNNHLDMNPRYEHERDHLMFIKAMVGHYREALAIANDVFIECKTRWYLIMDKDLVFARLYAHRGILTLLSGGSLEKAVADFDASLNALSIKIFEGSICSNHPHWTKYSWYRLEYLFHIYHILKHRGFAKHLNGDDIGARDDAQTAQNLHLRNLVGDICHSDKHYLKWVFARCGDMHGVLNRNDYFEIREDVNYDVISQGRLRMRRFNLLPRSANYLGFQFSL